MLPVGFEPTILVYLRICFFHIRTMLYQTKPWKRMFLLCGSNTHPSVIIKTSFLSDVPPNQNKRGHLDVPDNSRQKHSHYAKEEKK